MNKLFEASGFSGSRKKKSSFLKKRSKKLLSILLLGTMTAGTAYAQTPVGLLPGTMHHSTLTSTIPDNGDLNPYAVIVAPTSAGTIHQGDILVDNFNNLSNLQGTGTSIVAIDPNTHETRLFADLSKHEADCPGGIGLSTAMAMLKSGYIIVGSTPSRDGSVNTKGPGCLMVLDATGKFIASWTGPNINDPWGNVALVDNGTSAILFVSMAGFDVPGLLPKDPATGYPMTVAKAKVIRFDLTIPAGQPPQIASQTIIADGFGQRGDHSVFLIGPTGLALGGDGTLYVSDALGNRVTAVANAVNRTDSAGIGDVITSGGLLRRPLALILTPQNHLLAVNAQNGEVVEIDLAAKKQLFAQWIDTNEAQQPPGNGDLFGLALRPDGKGFYYVEDDVNALVEAGP